MPRKPGDVWNYYQILHSQGNKKHAVCIFCNTEYRNTNATRMVLHLTKCNDCPKDVMDKFTKKPIQPQTSSSPFVSASTSAASVSIEDDCNQDTSSEVIQENIDAALARAIFASGVPLSLLESSYWIQFLKLLNSQYKPPTRNAISNKLLNAEFLRVKTATENKIKESQAVTIMSDGWTNINGKGVINFIACTPDPVFYKAIYPETERETAEYVSNEVCKVIEEIGPSKIVAVVTDNAQNMKAAWHKICEKHPHVSCYGCVSHAINLVYNDILKPSMFKIITDSVLKIIKYVKTRHIILAFFESTQRNLYGQMKTSLKLPSKTRWNGIVISLESYLQNKEALKFMAVNDDLNIEKTIKNVILDEDLWIKVSDLLNLLKPIAAAVTTSESNKARVSDVPNTFLKLMATLNDNFASCTSFTQAEMQVIFDSVSRRRNFCIRPIHLAANLLDPRYIGSGLTGDEISTAVNFIQNQATFLNCNVGKVIANIADFKTKTNFFGLCSAAWLAAEAVDPAIWWQTFAYNQPLYLVAHKILSPPPSTGACERNWSLFSSVHTKQKNRLHDDRVIKLVTVRANLKLRDDLHDRKSESDEDITDYTSSEEIDAFVAQESNFVTSDSE